MPGLVLFKRRWAVGSDDCCVPGLFLFTIHLIWLIILSFILFIFEYNKSIRCIEFLWFYIIGYICILAVTTFIELIIICVSMRGSILDTAPRNAMQYWLYLRIIVMLTDIAALISGTLWLKEFYLTCPISEPKEVVLSSIICNWIVIFILLTTIWCAYDSAGRSWMKMKEYQRSMKESESRFNYRRSGSRSRNWRQRKVIRAYQESWKNRCRLLFCCMGNSDRSRNSFADIAKLLSDFFRDLDVVPSDIVVALVLLRKFQKLEREAIIRQKKNGIFRFLSGVPINETTHFLALNDSRDYEHFQLCSYYMYYALGAYGWPMYTLYSKAGVCQLCTKLKCCLMCCGLNDSAEIVEDNCCNCNYAALKKLLESVGETEIIYATYHVDIGETPFFVAIDYSKQKIVVSIRGTLSMQDILTDLNAEGEVLPLNPPKDDWVGHKGMVQAAVYIRNKLKEENLIERALNHNSTRNTQSFGIVLLGHSLGAGTAAILAILMKQEYSDLECFSYSPPGGLLSMPAVEYSKSFITSIVVGKDVVPRIGLHQMESLRADLINAIQRSVDPKWKTIACSMICCCCGPEPTSVTEMSTTDSNIDAYNQQKVTTRSSTHHPSDASIALTLHNPLYPPGKIIHVIRHHTTSNEQLLNKHEKFIYQAIWQENTAFDEVLISPVMLQDHMPDTVLEALEKCLTHIGPRKPQRQASCANSSITSEIIDPATLLNPTDDQEIQYCPSSPTLIEIQNTHNLQLTPVSRVCLETSFTNLQNTNDPAHALKPEQQKPTGKTKNVAFCKNDITYPARKFKPTTLSLCETRPNPFGKVVDLIHDDWFGLAPLASPESLSELSSISSRTSFTLQLNLTSSIEKCLNKMEAFRNTSSTVTTPSTIPASGGNLDIFESQLHTPKVMRRTPKFKDNLSNINEADNLAYKRMGQVFITNPNLISGSSSSNGSFETATSIPKPNCCTNDVNPLRLQQESSKSADEIGSSCNDNYNSQNTKFTSSDSATIHCNSGCPICPCTKLLYNAEGVRITAECCKRKNDHINCIWQNYGNGIQVNSENSSDTYHSAMSSLTGSDLAFVQTNNKFISPKLRTYEEEPTTISSITRSGILESHFPVFLDSGDERSSLISHENSPQASAKVVQYSQSYNVKSSKKSYLEEDFTGFSRNESLPLLSNLVEKSSPTNFVKRKKVVYPIHPVPSASSPGSFINLYLHRNESSV